MKKKQHAGFSIIRPFKPVGKNISLFGNVR